MNGFSREKAAAMLRRMVSPLSAPAAPAEAPKQKAPALNAPMIVLDKDDPEPYVPVGVGAIVEASSKLLDVNRGVATPDNRDHYAYKRVMTPAAFLKERIRLDADRARRQIAALVARKRSLSALQPGAFDSYVDGMINGNPLALPLEEINPLHLVEQARRLTHMGPGGIGSSDAITPEMQAVDASQFGFVSATEGPESELAGVDVRAATGTKLGSDNKIYQRFVNRDGDFIWLSPEDTQDLSVKLPD